MKFKPVTSLHTATTAELVAMCKLVQMVTHHEEFYKITPQEWNEYLCSSLKLEKEGADALINRSRRFANRILSNA